MVLGKDIGGKFTMDGDFFSLSLCAGQKFSLMDEGRILAKPITTQVNMALKMAFQLNKSDVC